MDFLNLKHLQQGSVQECEHDYLIEATSNGSSQYCPDCGSSHAVGFGRKCQLFMDAPVRGKRALLSTLKRAPLPIFVRLLIPSMER